MGGEAVAGGPEPFELEPGGSGSATRSRSASVLPSACSRTARRARNRARLAAWPGTRRSAWLVEELGVGIGTLALRAPASTGSAASLTQVITFGGGARGYRAPEGLARPSSSIQDPARDLERRCQHDTTAPTGGISWRNGALGLLAVAVLCTLFMAPTSGALHRPAPHGIEIAVPRSVPTQVATSSVGRRASTSSA